MKFSFLLFFTFCCLVYASTPFHRVVYEDDPKLNEVGVEFLKEAYGADSLIILPSQGPPPKKPKIYPGIILHTDSIYDPDWVLGSLNEDPAVHETKIEKAINYDLGLDDIDGKWDEYVFLSKIAPKIAPPITQLISTFKEAPLPQTTIARIRSLAQKYKNELLVANISTDSFIANCTKLEALRLSIEAMQGKSILKKNFSFHTEGRLPKTTDDWITMYLHYLLETKPQIKYIEESLSSTSVSVEDKIVELPYIEGRILEALIETPNEVIAQKMIKIGLEVRVHIVDGRIVEGGTLLRYFEFGEYLTPQLMQRIHDVLEEEFLKNIREKYGNFSASPDVVIETDTGKITIIDLNCGLESGYYYPEEDIFTTNLLAEHFSKRKPQFLIMFDEFKKATNSFSRIRALRKILTRYRQFITEYSEGAFWDRVWQVYRSRLYETPSPELFHEILMELYQAGLRSSWFFYQYINEVENSLTCAKLEGRMAEFWVEKLNSLKGGVNFKILPDGIRAYEETKRNSHNKRLHKDSKEKEMKDCAGAFRLIA